MCTFVYQCESQPEEQLREVVQAAHNSTRGKSKVYKRSTTGHSEDIYGPISYMTKGSKDT
jgi:hypothetical protein